jgi:hypothetical protein
MNRCTAALSSIKSEPPSSRHSLTLLTCARSVTPRRARARRAERRGQGEQMEAWVGNRKGAPAIQVCVASTKNPSVSFLSSYISFLRFFHFMCSWNGTVINIGCRSLSGAGRRRSADAAAAACSHLALKEIESRRAAPRPLLSPRLLPPGMVYGSKAGVRSGVSEGLTGGTSRRRRRR